MKPKLSTVTLAPRKTLLARIEAKAKADGCTVDEVIERALRFYFAAADIVKARG